MKNLIDSEISDGWKAYGLSRLISKNFNVPDGIVINENDIKNIIDGNTEEMESYLSDLRIYDDLAVRVSVSSKDRIHSYKGMFKSELGVPFNMKKLTDSIKNVNDCAKKKITESDNNISFNIIVQKMIYNSVMSGIAFSNIVEQNGDRVIMIIIYDESTTADKSQNDPSAVVTVKRNELFKENAKIYIDGKALDYSKMLKIARDVYRMEKLFNKSVIIGWWAAEKKLSKWISGKYIDIFYSYAEPMMDAEKIMKYFYKDIKHSVLSLKISTSDKIDLLLQSAKLYEKQITETSISKDKNFELNEKISVLKNKYLKLRKGQLFEFGFYNGNTLKWKVLEINSDSIYVLCVSLQCDKPFDESENKTNVWEQSTIRKWLNEKFYRRSFDNAEKECIKCIDSDKVLLLSKEEAETLLNPADRRDGHYRMLRSSYPEDSHSVYVFSYYDGFSHDKVYEELMIEPAMYLKR